MEPHVGSGNIAINPTAKMEMEMEMASWPLLSTGFRKYHNPDFTHTTRDREKGAQNLCRSTLVNNGASAAESDRYSVECAFLYSTEPLGSGPCTSTCHSWHILLSRGFYGAIIFPHSSCSTTFLGATYCCILVWRVRLAYSVVGHRSC